MAHAIFRSDKLTATDVSSKIFSVRYKVGNVEADIDNGNVVALGTLLPGSREVFEATTPSADTPKNNFVILGSPEVMYDERLKNLNDFYNAAGTNATGLLVESGDIFSVTKEALDGVEVPAKGNIVELQASTKLNVVVSLTSGSTQVGSIIDIEKVNNDTYYVIKVA